MSNRLIDIKGNKEKILDLLNIKRSGMKELREFLINSSYFTDPASTKFHNNIEGGLADHGLNFYTLLKEKNRKFNLGLTNQEVIVVSLLHDICKVGSYQRATRNEKITTYDKVFKKYKYVWVMKECWKFNDDMPLGHGEKSVIMLQNFIKLTDNEIFMIRYHMGMSLKDDELRNYYSAIDKYPCIVAANTADFEASQFIEQVYDDRIIG